MNETFLTNSAEETEAVGSKIAALFTDHSITSAHLALEGEMGVGKTAFTRGFCLALGIRSVKSPTYTVVNEYRGKNHTVYHFDMYRIEGEDDLYSIGFDEYLEKDAFCLIEWSENVKDLLPPDVFTVRIERTDDKNGRKITFKGEF